MSYPKKAKGWRILTVNNQQFRWCFVAHAENSIVKLQSFSSANQQAVVTLSGWRDPWLSVGSTDVLHNEPKVITAKFASQAIDFALQHGWKPDEAGATFRVEYKNEKFVIY